MPPVTTRINKPQECCLPSTQKSQAKRSVFANYRFSVVVAMPPISELGMEVPSFLAKLWDMLDDDANAHVIVWDPTGVMFAVNSPKQMGAQILGKYFRHNNFASFQRQLNYFGFHKCGKTEGGGCYYKHDHFLRNDPKDMVNIQRKTNHSSSSSSSSSSASPAKAGGAAAGGGAAGGRPGLALASAPPPAGRPRLAVVARAPQPSSSGGGAGPAVGGKRGATPLGYAAAADKRQRSGPYGAGLYVNDPGLVPVTPLTPVDGFSGRAASWDSAANDTPRAPSSSSTAAASSPSMPPPLRSPMGARSSPRLSAAVAAAAAGKSPLS